MTRWLQDGKNTKYCAQIDITKFYQSIDHEAAKEEFRRYIGDETALWLIDSIIDSYPVGLPIGTYTSQWFANWILQRMDHYIKETLHVKYAMRYMDDVRMFGRNKKELHRAISAIQEYLKPFGLNLKANWQVFRVDYIAEEHGIFITKTKRTEDLTQEVKGISAALRRAHIPHKVIYRRKYKDTKRRKRTHTGQGQYREIYIKIYPEYIEKGKPAVSAACAKLNRKPTVRRAEYGTRRRRRGRDVDFMGFRFYRDHVTIRRKNCLRVRRTYARAAKKKTVDVHTAQGCLSYLGLVKHTNSHNFTVKYIDNVKPVRELKEVVRNAAKDSGGTGGGQDRSLRTEGICPGSSYYRYPGGTGGGTGRRHGKN